MIKRTIVIAMLFALVVLSANATTPPPPTDTLTAGCRILVSEFKQELMGEFMAAMKTGGPVNAISVCQVKAPEVAAHFSGLEGWSMRRTALRVRNTKNTADDFECAAMTMLEIDTVGEFSRWLTDADGNTKFRYVSAITMASPCATCHGDPDNISDSVKSAIARTYPDDQAVGFAPGQLRGAFSITVDWPAGQAVADSLYALTTKKDE